MPGAKINSITEELARKGGVRVNHLTLELDVPALADPAKLLYLSQLQLLRVCGLYHNGGDLQVYPVYCTQYTQYTVHSIHSILYIVYTVYCT